MNEQAKEFILYNALMLSFEDLVEKFVIQDDRAEAFDRKANKNRVTQQIISFVKQRKLRPCFYNPVSGRYEVLPSDMIFKLQAVQYAEKKFPVGLYRQMRKAASYQATKKAIDPMIQSAMESRAEKEQEKKEFLKAHRNNRLFFVLLGAAFLALYLVVSALSGFWPF